MCTFLKAQFWMHHWWKSKLDSILWNQLASYKIGDEPQILLKMIVP